MTSSSAPRIPLSESAVQLAQAGLALIEDLAKSLLGSQKALLIRDLAAIERGTREQIGLVRALHTLRLPDGLISRSSSSFAGGEDRRSAAASERATNLVEQAKRLRHLARLQAALLRRAQAELRVHRNLLAAPGETYGPLLEQGRRGPCRV